MVLKQTKLPVIATKKAVAAVKKAVTKRTTKRTSIKKPTVKSEPSEGKAKKKADRVKKTTIAKKPSVKKNSKKKRTKRRRRKLSPEAKAARTRVLQRALRVNEALAAVIGKTECSRSEAVKLVWQYVREHDLKDKDDGRFLVCDKKLLRVFNNETIVHFTKVPKLLNDCFLTSEPSVGPDDYVSNEDWQGSDCEPMSHSNSSCSSITSSSEGGDSTEPEDDTEDEVPSTVITSECPHCSNHLRTTVRIRPPVHTPNVSYDSAMQDFVRPPKPEVTVKVKKEKRGGFL